MFNLTCVEVGGKPLWSEVGSTISAGYAKAHGMLYEIFQPYPGGIRIGKVKVFTAFNG